MTESMSSISHLNEEDQVIEISALIAENDEATTKNAMHIDCEYELKSLWDDLCMEKSYNPFTVNTFRFVVCATASICKVWIPESLACNLPSKFLTLLGIPKECIRIISKKVDSAAGQESGIQ